VVILNVKLRQKRQSNTICSEQARKMKEICFRGENLKAENFYLSETSSREQGFVQN
jgi:hypothetical protein